MYFKYMVDVSDVCVQTRSVMSVECSVCVDETVLVIQFCVSSLCLVMPFQGTWEAACDACSDLPFALRD